MDSKGGLLEMTEKSLEQNLRREVLRLGGLCWKFTSPGTAGVPDRVVILNGEVIFVELKGDHGLLSKLQKLRLKQLKEAGVKAIVCKGDLLEFYNAIQSP